MLQETWLTDPPTPHPRYSMTGALARQSKGRHHHNRSRPHTLHQITGPQSQPPSRHPPGTAKTCRLHGGHLQHLQLRYNTPNTPYSLAPILRLHETTATDQIIMGDFNTHHSAWGRNNTDTRWGCTLLAEVLLDIATHALMNDDSPTHRSSSSIDLCILYNHLAASASWRLTELYSDHHAPN